MSKNKATCIGLTAIFLWSLLVGLIRGISENFGAIGGAALLYTFASVILACTIGLTNLRDFPRRYLLLGSLLFVACELCFSLSIGYANTNRQAIEASMLNYLWPSLTIIFAILFNQQKSSLMIIPGFLLSTLGICWLLSGDQGLDLFGMWENIQDNPLSYGLALSSALLWASYCTVIPRIAGGKNAITLFFILVAAVLWIQYLFSDESNMSFNMQSLIYLLVAASAIGFGYVTWNIGILHGHITILAGASYFIPVLSAALAALVLRAPLSLQFWQGACIVSIGSIICWLATRPEKNTNVTQ